ncbi:MAG: hypothetical protein AAF530_20045 [Pseudomonadota bacterium]
MTKQSITFEDIITDRDGNASKAQFVALARELIGDGRRPDRVFRAMLSAAYETSIEHCEIEHYRFVVSAAADTADWKKQLEKIIDDELNEPQNKAFLKEIGLVD